MTQSSLASEMGCKQSALSMFEQGDGTKLNEEVINRLAKKFGLQIATGGKASAHPATVPLEVAGTGYCPNPKCPSNHRYQVGDKALYRPERAVADPVGGRYCAVCGELLERRCPNCGSPVHEGAVCSLCGEPYVAGV